MIEIKRWDNGKIIHSGDFSSAKECLEDGAKKGISFSFAKLNGAELKDAKLNYAELNGAKLNDAELNYAELNYAELNGAELNGAELKDAKLNYAELNGVEAVSIPSGEKYYLFISHDVVQAGCESHSPDEWRRFSKEDVLKMDGTAALEFYPRLLDLMDFFLGKGERPEWL